MFEPPYPPYDPTDPSGFSYETVVKRWPVILTGVIDTVYRVNHADGVAPRSAEATSHDAVALAEKKIAEGKGVIEKISKLKYEMARDKALEPIANDGEPGVEVYNNELARLAQDGKNTWFTAPWLFAECYLYRLVRSYFAQTTQWRTFDPFADQKMETFRQSGKAVYQLGRTMHELESEKDALVRDPSKLGILFKEMVQMCLWGNATDLSLLTHLSHEDIAHLQTVGKDAQAARAAYILRDDQEKVWEHVKSLEGKDARVDFVLDNSGFELFTDLVFADFLVTYTPYVSKVVFHPKLIPWFVSDVTPPDFAATIPALLSDAFFPTADPEEHEYLNGMVRRWQTYLSSGVFSLSVPAGMNVGDGDSKADFWTSPWPYWDMKERAPGVWDSLRGSGLVVFKGDLNYRKLTGDVQWPVSTPFAEALGPLAGSFPILSLRTNKADVIVGVKQDVADALDEKGEKWRVNGKYAVVSFLP